MRRGHLHLPGGGGAEQPGARRARGAVPPRARHGRTQTHQERHIEHKAGNTHANKMNHTSIMGIYMPVKCQRTQVTRHV